MWELFIWKKKIINKNKIQTFKKRITCVIFNDHNNIQTKSKLGQLLLHVKGVFYTKHRQSIIKKHLK